MNDTQQAGLVEEDMIDLLLEIFRMGELRSQIAIVGEQKHTRGVTVETTYRIDTLRTSVLHEVHHRLALLRIVRSRDIILGFVEQHIHFLLDADGLVVETNLVGAQHLGSEFGHHLTIDGDNTCLDELVCLATAAHTSIGQELIQTQRRTD